MKKFSLESEYDDDYLMLGISCHMRDYRFCWMLNKYLDVDLSRSDDFFLSGVKTPKQEVEVVGFSLFEFNDEENYLTWMLISNKSETGFLINEKKNLDFFLVLKGPYEFMNIPELIQSIKKIPGMQMCMEIDAKTLKVYKNLVLD